MEFLLGMLTGATVVLILIYLTDNWTNNNLLK